MHLGGRDKNKLLPRMRGAPPVPETPTAAIEVLGPDQKDITPSEMLSAIEGFHHRTTVPMLQTFPPSHTSGTFP